MAGLIPRSQSFILHATLTHCQPEWRSLELVQKYLSELPARNVLTALTATAHSRNPTLLATLDHLTEHPVLSLQYVRAFIERRFVDAYDLWRQIPEVEKSLTAHLMPSPSYLTQTMAVVLPGQTDGFFGNEIDAHDLVARTGLIAPTADEKGAIGSRFDIAFLNPDRFRTLVESPVSVHIPAARIVVNLRDRTKLSPSWLTTPIDRDLDGDRSPMAIYPYILLRIVPWCFERGIRPTLYFADFYLGSTSYQSADYDPEHLLQNLDDYILSYLRHDVFYSHAALQRWQRHGVIHARGRLGELLELDGRSFAQLIQHRWARSNTS